MQRLFGEHKYNMVKVVCPVCGDIREVIEGNTRRKGFTGLCRKCWDSKCKSYWYLICGYVAVWLPRTHWLYCMTNQDNYVLEHRFVMAENLARPLTKEEVVHHKDGNRVNNHIDNLILYKSHAEHMADHKTKGEVL